MDRSWMAAWEDRNAAELWSSRFLRPRPPIFVYSPANDHTVSLNELHRNDSIQSQSYQSFSKPFCVCGVALHIRSKLISQIMHNAVIK